jgi:hypothetical protein
MATTLYAYKSITKIGWTVKNAVDSGSTPDKREHTITKTFTEGVGANQAQNVAHKIGTVGTSATVALDLSGTALQTAFGVNIAMTEIKELLFENTGTVPLLLGGGSDGAGAAAVPLFGTGTEAVVISVPAGGHVKLSSPTAGGVPVTATSADILGIENTDGATAGAYKLTIAYN